MLRRVEPAIRALLEDQRITKRVAKWSTAAAVEALARLTLTTTVPAIPAVALVALPGLTADVGRPATASPPRCGYSPAAATTP